MKTRKFHSYNQSQLKELSDAVCDNIEELLKVLEIENYKLLDKMIIMNCPIHGGDNSSAFNLYYQGDNYRGNWKCRTHQCEEVFKSSIIGFVRGCLSKSKYGWTKDGDETITFIEALNFCKDFAKQNNATFKKVSKKDKEKVDFVNTVNYIKPKTETPRKKIYRQNVISSLDIPSKYYLSRNYSEEILIKYDVGECVTFGKEMYNRAVVPIYDPNHQIMIGCSGRSINEAKPKWRHSSGFKAEENLYNFWYAKKYIKDTGVAIIVESPGNVWRLEESGIHNALAIFGSSLSDRQKMLLDTSGAMTIITIMDNDEAGKKAAEQINKKCQRTYNVKNIKIENYSDIADMSVDQINQELKPIIESSSLC